VISVFCGPRQGELLGGAMRATWIATILAFAVLTGTSSRAGESDRGVAPDHRDWVSAVITETRTVTIGMTRTEVLKVFTTEGGLSTGLRRTYVYRGCPYVKVDVEFEPAGRPARDGNGRLTLGESGADVITSISKPYLEWSIVD